MLANCRWEFVPLRQANATMARTREELILSAIRRLLNGTSLLSPRQAGKLGYRLLSRPRRLPLEPVHQAFLDQAQQTKQTLAGIPIQTYCWPNSGPGVLLLHGWESHTGRWQEFYKALSAAGFAIYAFDAPAHGKSGGDSFTVVEYAAVMKDFLAQLASPPIYWVGHSAGGMAILYYLSELEHSIRPERIVAMSVPGELTDFLAKFQQILQVKNRVVNHIEVEFMRRMQLTFSDISPRCYAKKVKIPGLIIHDVDDDLAPIEGAEDIYKNWENSSLIITEGLGHSVNGVEIVELVTEYLLLKAEEIE